MNNEQQNEKHLLLLAMALMIRKSKTVNNGFGSYQLKHTFERRLEALSTVFGYKGETYVSEAEARSIMREVGFIETEVVSGERLTGSSHFNLYSRQLNGLETMLDTNAMKPADTELN